MGLLTSENCPCIRAARNICLRFFSAAFSCFSSAVGPSRRTTLSRAVLFSLTPILPRALMSGRFNTGPLSTHASSVSQKKTGQDLLNSNTSRGHTGGWRKCKTHQRRASLGSNLFVLRDLLPKLEWTISDRKPSCRRVASGEWLGRLAIEQ